MRGHNIKGLILAVVAIAFASLWAAPVSCDQARTAVRNWLRTDPALGCRLGRSVDSARTCVTTNGVNFHVVKLAGGGFVVMSADTTQEPVVAFSDSDDLVESADNPLWGILQHDFSLRARVPAVRARAVSAPSAAEAKWAKLLEDAPTARSGNGIASVSDLRVDAMVKSKWGQTKNSVYNNYGENCYNFSTPSNYPCGCAATALAQLLRHYCYPSAARAVTRKCIVTSTTNDYSTSGTPYDWANMPLIPEADEDITWYDGGSSPAECAAIGKLTYECGIAMQMHWDSGPPDKDVVSSAFGAFAFEPLTNVFRFANARSYCAEGSGNLSIDLVKRVMLPNLDAGCPVLLGLYEHEVVADGYGFSDGQLYTHLNMGWSGTDNAWYNLPNVEPAEMYEITGYSSSIVNHIIYNIFTNETGELLSGRVVAADGVPIENAQVTVSQATGTTSGGTELATTLTNGRGIYFFRLPGGKTYRVTASVGALSQTLPNVGLTRSINPSSVNLLTASYSIGNMAAGNSWGNDFAFNGISSVAVPEFNPPSCLFHPTTNVAITCATSGATIRYTLDGSDPDATSPEFWASSPIVVTADTTIKARAFKDGLNPSAIVTATYTYDISQDAPAGDFYANPIVISGTEGSYAVPDNINYTREDGEPWHTYYESNPVWYYDYHSIWYSWTAPGSGSMTFNALVYYPWGYYNSILAVYVGDTIDTAERIVFNTECDANSGATSVSFDVEQGVTYHIVSASFWEEYDYRSSMQLSWFGSLTIPSEPEPRTLYVNAALPANMQQDGLTPTTAFRDLPAAMAILQDGDTVLVAPGTYSPAVVTASNVTVRATGTVAETIIDGGGTNPCCWDTHAIDSFPRCLTAEFEGFTLVNGRGVVLGPNQNPFGGGAIGVKLSRCVISNCVANVAAGAYCCELRNCLIVGNTATTYAGGLGDCTLVGCTVYGNSASNLCGGIDFHCVATNSIIWGNHVVDRSSQSQDDVEDLFLEDPVSGLERLTAQLDHCCSSSLADGVGNIAGDPKFYDAAAGDFRLRPNSPCLDVGTPVDISSTEIDLAGNPRIREGALDMGAYEGAFAISGIRLLSAAQLWYDETEQTGSVMLECDGAWQVWCDTDWIVFHAMPESGDATLEFTILANNTGSPRTAEVVIVDTTGNVVSFLMEQAAVVPRTFYVNAALPAGMQQDGLSATTAFHDLPAAMAILQDGDTVLVAPGTYSPAVVGASNVTIKATGDVAATIIDGGGTNACCSVDIENDSATATFEGFTLVNGGGVSGVNERFPTRLFGGGAWGVALTRCIISNCVADVGGGAFNCDLRNCLVVDNVANFYAGGASKCSLVGCTVSENSASQYSGGIDCDCVATNCIVWGNAVGNGSSPDFEASTYGTAQMAYCCSSSQANGVGNLAADPKFRNAASGDFRLRPNSPCLDVGTLADISSTESDLVGNVRIQDGVPDIGAYEGKFPLDAIRLLSPDSLLYNAAGQVGSATLECDSTWQVSCSANWIVFQPLPTSGDATIAFTLLANTGDVSRKADVVIVDGANNAVTFQVRQAAAAMPPVTSNRYFGLFVGLNEYDAATWRREGYDVGPLQGAVSDATNVCARFTDWGFCRREDALVLTNNLATVSAIRTALANIAAQAVAGDTVLYYHSGHGYQSTGTTVALIGYADYYWDYDLAADLGLFADGVRVVVMADTCHSGGLFKGGGTRSRRTFNLAERVQSLMSANRLRSTRRGATGGTAATLRTLASPSQVGWITAADYNQSSWDSLDGVGGLFTLACLDGWRTGAADTDGDGRVNFYDLWLYAKDAGAETAANEGEETEGQCFNEELLMAVLAGVTDNSTSETETFNTPVRVPYSWLARYMQNMGFAPSAGTTTGGATYSFADYAAAAETTKTTAHGQTISAWQDYVAGTDPADSNSVFTAGVTITNGVPYIYWTPDLGRDERDYIVYGREDLTSGSWGPTNAASRFFKVEVRMK